MASIHPHKRHGWRIKYRVWFPDGNWTDKEKYAKKKTKAQIVHNEAASLEDLSRRRVLTAQELSFFVNRRYLGRQEAESILPQPLPGTHAWGELEREYEEYSRKNSSSAYTHACNMTKLKKVMEYFRGHDPSSITEEVVQAYIDKRLKDKVEKGKPDKNFQRRLEPLKSATVEKEINLLRILLDPLGGQHRVKGIWPDNPARLVSPPRKLDERLPQPLWRDDIGAFYRALRKHRAKLYGYLVPLAMTYLYAGLRPTELINLTPKDVNLAIGKITVQGKPGVRTKTGRARAIEIHPKILVFIESALRKGGPYVFGGEKRITPDSVSRAIRKVIEDAGREGLTPYSLRHTFITALLRSGADIREVQDRAGHSRLSTTMRYLHVAPTKNPVKRIKFRD